MCHTILTPSAAECASCPELAPLAILDAALSMTGHAMDAAYPHLDEYFAAFAPGALRAPPSSLPEKVEMLLFLISSRAMEMRSLITLYYAAMRQIGNQDSLKNEAF